MIKTLEIFVNRSLVPPRFVLVLIANTASSFYHRFFDPSFSARLLSFFETLWCRMILWVQKFVFVQSNQPLLFRLHQSFLMSSSCGIPTCKSSMSKLVFLETVYATCKNSRSSIPTHKELNENFGEQNKRTEFLKHINDV